MPNNAFSSEILSGHENQYVKQSESCGGGGKGN